MERKQRKKCGQHRSLQAVQQWRNGGVLESRAMAGQAEEIAGNIAHIRERVARAAERAGRDADEITLVAVSKTFPAEAIRSAYTAGVRHFGENRLQEFESKRAAVADLDATWHMIGHVQSNKARKVAEIFSRIDSIDRLSIAEKLDAAIAEHGARRQLAILIEVKLGGEQSKSGIEQAALPQLAGEIARKCAHLQLRGLMTIPPYADNPVESHPYFRRLRELRDALQRETGLALPVLSMGMSHDFEVAIEEGATEIRIGTAIFGQRRKVRND